MLAFTVQQPSWDGIMNGDSGYKCTLQFADPIKYTSLIACTFGTLLFIMPDVFVLAARVFEGSARSCGAAAAV